MWCCSKRDPVKRYQLRNNNLFLQNLRLRLSIALFWKATLKCHWEFQIWVNNLWIHWYELEYNDKNLTLKRDFSNWQPLPTQPGILYSQAVPLHVHHHQEEEIAYVKFCSQIYSRSLYSSCFQWHFSIKGLDRWDWGPNLVLK